MNVDNSNVKKNRIVLILDDSRFRLDFIDATY